MSSSTLWKVKIDVHQIYNLRLSDSNELPDPYIAASLEFPRSSEMSVPIQRSAAKSKTSSGIFNAVLLFIANISDFDFNKVKLVVKVHNGRKLTELLDSDGAVIGSCTFALSKIFSQTKHWVPREWFPLTSPSSPGDCRGYINLSVGVFGPGDDVPSQLNDFQLLAAEGINEKLVVSRSVLEKIVQTPETNFNNCMLIFNVLRAEGLPVLSSVQTNAYVQVSFGGVKLQSRVIPTNSNPAWNESMRIPVLYPSWDQYVVVEVFSRINPKQTDPTRDIYIGSTVFDFDTLYRQGIQPTWFNLYAAPGASISGFSAMFGGEYSGRVQVSANVARSSDLNANIIPVDTSAIKEPVTEEIVVYVDIYELGFLDDAIRPEQIPSEIWVQIQFGTNIFESEHISNSNMTCVFGDNLGRLEPIRIHLPLDRSMAYDMVLSVCGSSMGDQRSTICFTRIPLEKFLVVGISGPQTSASADPEWIRLCRIRSRSLSDGVVGTLTNMVGDLTTLLGVSKTPSAHAEYSLETVANILANIIAFPVVESAGPRERPLRIPYLISSYELRISVHQATKLPIAPGSSVSGILSSPFVRVTLAGVSARTGVIPCTLYPTWNELLRIGVDLPQIPTLRPDVLVEVIDQPTNTVLGSVSIKSSGLRSQPNESPTWYRLSGQSTNKGLGVEQEALVLCSLALVPIGESDKFPPPLAIPQRASFSVDVLIVGVRLLRNYSIENLNQIELSWGRHRNKPGRSVVTIRSADPIAGVGGQFNFLQPALVEVDLPLNSTFQEFLEVRLVEKQELGPELEQDGRGAASDWLNTVMGGGPSATLNRQGTMGGRTREKAIGYGFLHLNPHYAWISDAERSQCRELFRMKTVEELRKLEEQRVAKETALNESQKVRYKSRAQKKSINKDILELEYMEDTINSFFGISMVTDENTIEYPVDCFNAVETDALLPPGFKAFRPKSSRRGAETAIQIDSAVSTSKKATKFVTEFVWEPTVSKEKSGSTRHEIDGELELDPEQLPFISLPLVAPGDSASGESFIVVGYLKIRCRVREKSSDSSELLNLQKTFVDQFEMCHRLMCRLYVLRAEGIVPSQTSSTDSGGRTILTSSDSSSYFLWIRNVAGELIAEYPNCSIKDDGGNNTDSKIVSLNPEFNKCFQLPCSFPENSVLYIELYERRVSAALATVTGLMTSQAVFTDTLVGSALIDIENRWFHADYQRSLTGASESSLNKKSLLPIETWTLRSSDGVPKGKLKFWLEVMDQGTSMGRPIETLPSPQPENLEVRIVLWRTKAVVKPEGEEHCHQGVSVFMQDLPSQDSDTHYGSMDGTGTFNWRFVFNPKVPSEDSTVRFQIQHRPLTSIAGIGYDALGEVTLDLANELATVRRTRRAIDLPKCWVPLTHSAFVGKVRGYIEIQIRILAGEEAKAFPVGRGRDSPNTDPFLDGEDAHLLQHRDILANTVVGRSLAKFVQAMTSGIRTATIIFIVGLVISGIIGIVVFLAYIGVIKF